jgi:hypothetical protein
MNEIIGFLNSNNGLFSLIFSFFVMLSTIIYAILTIILVKETRKMRKSQTEPKIQIVLETIESSVNTLKLNIKNIGQGPAFNVVFNSTVIGSEKIGENILNKFSSIKAFSSGLNYLGPSNSFNTGYYNVLSINKEDMEKLFEVKISIEVKYNSITKTKYKDIILIDFSELIGTYQLGKPNLLSIAQSLEKIEKNIYNVTSGFRKMKIDLYDSVDRQNEEKEINERYEQFNMK